MTIHSKIYGQGKPLVLFHGWGFDHRIWLSLVPHLKDHYQLILVDLPGFGCTELMEWALFKKQLLNMLPPQFCLLGWSMGGLYAMRLAIEDPLRVDRLVNIASSPRFVQDDLWPGISRDALNTFHSNLALDSEKTLNEFIALQLLNKRSVVDHYSMLASPEGLKSGLSVLDLWDLRTSLSLLRQPVCFMFGRLDPITPAQTMTAMQAAYPDFKYILFKKAAHMPFLSHPELFMDALLEFIQ